MSMSTARISGIQCPAYSTTRKVNLHAPGEFRSRSTGLDPVDARRNSWAWQLLATMSKLLTCSHPHLCPESFWVLGARYALHDHGVHSGAHV